jgi:hypothetical protein
LPALLAVLAIRPGAIERVTYNLTAWNPTERRLPFGDHPVRLEGFRAQDPSTVTVIGEARQRLTLLVVPPETAPAAAEHALMTASKPENVETVEALLAPGDTASDIGTVARTDAATQRWEVDGGRVYERA